MNEGKMVDASFTIAPRQRNTREENKVHEKGYRNKPLTEEQKANNLEKLIIKSPLLEVSLCI